MDALGHTIFVNFLLSWTAIYAMIRCHTIGALWWPIFLWLAHSTVFVSIVFALHMAGLYEGPSPFFTTWSAIIRMQALITIIVHPYVWRQE